MSNYALRIPNSLFDYAKQCAEEDSVSMNQFFVMAIAEKVSALKTAEFFRERAGRADPVRAESILRKVKDRPPVAGDEMPVAPHAPIGHRSPETERQRSAKRVASKRKRRVA